MTTRALLLCVAVTACGPGQTKFATPPGGAATFDPAASDAKAVTIADQVLAAAGGEAAWSKAKQIRWQQSITSDGAVTASGEQAWDRWNGRHQGRLNVSEDNSIVVMRELYGDSASAFTEHRGNQTRISGGDADKALAGARDRWQFDTAALFMPFLMKSPGTTLKFVGDAMDETNQPTLDEIKVVFDPKDTTRQGPSFHVIVRRDNHLIERIEMVPAGQPDTSRIGYRLRGWVDAGGLKVPTRLENIGLKSEVLVYADVQVGDPDDSLYIPTVQ